MRVLLSEGTGSRPPVAFWTLTGVMVTVPLALAPSLQFFDVTPKVCVLLVGACLVWITLAVENRFPNFRGPAAKFFLLVAALAFVAALATLFSRAPVLSLVGSEWRRMGLPAWLACLALTAAIPTVVDGNRSRREHLIAAMAISALVAASYGFGQYIGYDRWINSDLYTIGEGEQRIVRPPATLGHANYFAAFSLLAVFSSAGLALSASATRVRLLWGAVAAALALALVVSGSRGAWLGGLAGVVVLCTRVRDRRVLLLGLLAVTALGGVFVISPLGRPMLSRLRAFAGDPGSMARVLIWRDSARLVWAHPLLGTGPDTYELSFPDFESAELARHIPDHSAESPHNIVLDYMTTAGILAALIFALLMATALRRYVVVSREQALDASLFAALIAGLVAAQFIADTIPTRLALLAFAALSVSAPAAGARGAVRGGVAAVSMTCLALAVLFGWWLAWADRAMLQASGAVARGDLNAALHAGRTAHRAFPWTGTYAFAFSKALAEMVIKGNFPPPQRDFLLAAAEEAARDSLPHSAQPQRVYVHLASLQVLRGKQEEAKAALQAAVWAAPAWYRPRWLLAVLLAARGRHREAAEQASAALERGARKHPEIAASCLAIRRLSPERVAPPPGQFEFPQAFSSAIGGVGLCGGSVFLSPGLRLERSATPVLTPGSEGSWDSLGLSNPTLLEQQGGFLLFYSGFDGRAWRTGLARSPDGKAWQKLPQPLLAPSLSGWDSGDLAANGSVLLEQGKFLYWYQGGRVPRIGFATWRNGENRRKHPGPVLEPGPVGSWDSTAVSDPFVFMCGKTLFLYYRGEDSSGLQRLGVASSRDGIHWAKYPGNPLLSPGPKASFDESGVGQPAVQPISGGVAMFYTGRDASQSRRIGLAFSSDGVNWRKAGVALDVSRTGWDSGVVTDPYVSISGNRLQVWYVGSDVAGPKQNLQGSIGLATATLEQGQMLDYTRAKIDPPDTRPDTPNGRWAFAYGENSLVTLARSSMTFTIVVPARARFRAEVRMPLPGADPAGAAVWVNEEELFSGAANRGLRIDVDLVRFAGQRIELQLAATPGPRGERASWVEWRNPRIAVEAAP